MEFTMKEFEVLLLLAEIAILSFIYDHIMKNTRTLCKIDICIWWKDYMFLYLQAWNNGESNAFICLVLLATRAIDMKHLCGFGLSGSFPFVFLTNIWRRLVSDWRARYYNTM